MRPGVAWQGPHAELFEEAMRVVPAAAKLRASGTMRDVAALYRDFLDRAGELGICPANAWSVLASAQSVWLQNLFELYADECGTTTEFAIDSAISAAVDWAENRG